jgi:ADP-ribosylation factor GTPase-activating protein 2/3
MSGLASKQQSLKIFEKLKTKPANKVRAVMSNAP